MKQYLVLDKCTPLTGALDFSWLLDAPAGKHGFVRVKDGHLYFEDGTRALFIGMCFPVRSCLCDHDSSEKLAQKMAGLGVNVIRIHAVDAVNNRGGWAMEPDMPLIDYRKGNSRTLNPEGLERLDWFVYQLKIRGIYVHMDLNVARKYVEGDDLDYEGNCSGKMLGMVNRRLIELQKEYARQLLTHVNQYTGLAYTDDPCVMTVQITNEDTVELYGASSTEEDPTPYAQELQRRFNRYLLSRYDTRAHLAEKWTHDGACALEADEDPVQGTVRIPYRSDWRFVCDPAGNYVGKESPARHADFLAFAVMLTREYYMELGDELREAGVKVPIAYSNLVHGAPEVYAMSGADVMENNAYWNHPQYDGESRLVPEWREFITSDPRQFGTYREQRQRSGQNLTQMSQSPVAGKPFIVTEWNEYGSMPYHSACMLMTAAYACLQDWDGLIMYCYFTRGASAYDQTSDAVENIMESYNDPAFICQHGMMAYLFLKRPVSPAKLMANVAWTQNDVRTFWPGFSMASSYVPYVCGMRNVYMEERHYHGDAELVIKGGATASGDFREAKHAFLWSETDYADAYFEHRTGDKWRAFHRQDGAELPGGGTVGATRAVCDDTRAYVNDPVLFSRALDKAMKVWGLIAPDAGLVGDEIVSDTRELRYAPDRASFIADAPRFAAFAGRCPGSVKLGSAVLSVSNDRMTASLVPLDGQELASSRHMLLTMVGKSGNEFMHFEGEKCRVIMDGKLTADIPEGSFTVKGEGAVLYALDVYGKRIKEMPARTEDGCTVFTLTGDVASVNYEAVL